MKVLRYVHHYGLFRDRLELWVTRTHAVLAPAGHELAGQIVPADIIRIKGRRSHIARVVELLQELDQ